MPPPGTLGSNAEAEFRRFCTGNSRLRVPTYRTSILVSRTNSCWTPSDHVITFGSTMSRINACVLARASAVVVGGTLNCRRPPPERNPGPGVGLPPTTGPDVHHAGGGGLVEEQVAFVFCSVCNSGGRLLMAKLRGMTSYAIWPPPRMDHLPWPVGSQANPTCGPKLFVSEFGLRKINPTAGSFAIAFSACFPSSRGTPDHSYRNPRFNVSRDVAFQSSCTNQ